MNNWPPPKKGTHESDLLHIELAPTIDFQTTPPKGGFTEYEIAQEWSRS